MEHLLSRSQTNTTGLDQEEELDLLNLDETLFEGPGSNSKAKSEGNLNSSTGPSEEPPHLSREASDPGNVFQQPIPPTVRIDEPPTSINREHKSYGDMPIHPSSRRTSTTSGHSDMSSDFERSPNSSTLFKSVRFEIEDDSGVDSGVTGTSTPYGPEISRRASEPEFKASHHTVRRASAPECKSLESVSDEGSGNELQSSDARLEPKDNKEYVRLQEPNSQPSVVEQLVTSDGTRREETDNASWEQHDPATQQPSPIQIAPLFMNTPPTTPKRRCKIIKLPSSPLRVAHLIATVEHKQVEDTSARRNTLPKSHVKPSPSLKIVEMRQRFQQQAPVKEESTQPPEPAKRKLSISKLITEKTQQLLQEPLPKEKPILKPHKMTVQWPKPNDSHEYESSSSSSVLLSSSVPVIDLSNTRKETSLEDKPLEPDLESRKDKLLESEPESRKDKPLESDRELESKRDGSSTSLTASSQVSGLGDDMADSATKLCLWDEDDESEPVPWFERSLSNIPLFTTPFGPKFSQPSLMKGGEQLSNFWSFSGKPDTSNEPMGLDFDDSDSSDDEMVPPLTPSRSSPFGKGLSLSSQSQTAKLHISAIKDMKLSQLTVNEPFQRPIGYQQKLASRLSAIPEESPEVTRSRTSLSAFNRINASARH